MKDRYVSSGIPFLRSQNIRPGSISLEDVMYIDSDFHSELKKSTLTEGDVVVVRTGTPGISSAISKDLPIANCSDLVIVRPIAGLQPEFLAWFINSPIAKDFVVGNQVGVAQQHFNVGRMKEMPIPLCAFSEQMECANAIKSAWNSADAIQLKVEDAYQQLSALEQSILAKAFRGELVPKTPPTNPPASSWSASGHNRRRHR
jgi:type I restriction enzyme S subunit